MAVKHKAVFTAVDMRAMQAGAQPEGTQIEVSSEKMRHLVEAVTTLITRKAIQKKDSQICTLRSNHQNSLLLLDEVFADISAGGSETVTELCQVFQDLGYIVNIDVDGLSRVIRIIFDWSFERDGWI